MGRTLPTFNAWLEREMDSWREFRRALRREDREAFDRLFALAKAHMAEAAQAARPAPFEAMVVGVLLELHKKIEQQQRDLELLRAGNGREHAQL